MSLPAAVLVATAVVLLLPGGDAWVAPSISAGNGCRSCSSSRSSRGTHDDYRRLSGGSWSHSSHSGRRNFCALGTRNRSGSRRSSRRHSSSGSSSLGGTGRADQAKLDAFAKWLASNNVKDSTHVKVGLSPSGESLGLGLIATRAIEKGEQCVLVPLNACITAENVLKGPLGPYLMDWEGWTGDTGLIALHLLWEKSQGAASPLHPWLEVLPQAGELDHLPLFWSADEVSYAEGCTTRGFMALREDVSEDHDWIRRNVLEVVASGADDGKGRLAAKAIEKAGIQLEDALSLENFKWAVGVAMSRAFFVDGQLRLTPLVDFANHSPSSTREPSSTGLGIFGGRGVRLQSSEALQPGEELFISYGPKGAAAYLEESGFVAVSEEGEGEQEEGAGGGGGGGEGGGESGSAADAAVGAGAGEDEAEAQGGMRGMFSDAMNKVSQNAQAYLEENGGVEDVSRGNVLPPGYKEITCEMEFGLKEGDRFINDKIRVLEDLGLESETRFDLSSTGEPDPEMIQFLRLRELAVADSFMLEAVFIDEVWEFCTEPISASNEAAVNGLLLERCDAELTRMKLTADEAEPPASMDPDRLALLTRIRTAESMALEHVMAWCRQDNQALDRKEYYQERRLRDLQLDGPLQSSEVVDSDGMSRGASSREIDW